MHQLIIHGIGGDMAPHPRASAIRRFFTAIQIAARPGSASLGTRAAAMPRMIKATLNGSFLGSSKGRLAMMLGAALYIISPIDLVPEAVLGVFGLIDDAFVATWLASEVVNTTESFLEWEHEVTSAAHSPDAATGHQASNPGGEASGSTVRGSVVP